MNWLFLAALCSGWEGRRYLRLPDASSFQVRAARPSHPRRVCGPRCELPDPDEREEALRVVQALESARDWVSKDIAAAAMQATREKRSIDAFISTLQDELLQTGEELQQGIDLVESFLDEQATAMTRDKRADLMTR